MTFAGAVVLAMLVLAATGETVATGASSSSFGAVISSVRVDAAGVSPNRGRVIGLARRWRVPPEPSAAGSRWFATSRAINSRSNTGSL